MLRIFLISLAVVFAGHMAVANPKSPGAAWFDFGFFCAVETVDTQAAEDTISGVVNLVDGPPPFIRKTTTIPGKIGIGFGIHIDVLPEYQGQATVVTLHPPMGDTGVTRESWTASFTSGNTNYNGFTFEYDYELRFGQWNLSATRDGQQIYSVDFLVVDPASLPPTGCGEAILS